MRHSIFSNFNNLSMNWEKHAFHWEKWKNFEPIEKSTQTTDFLAFGKVMPDRLYLKVHIKSSTKNVMSYME